MPTCTNIGCGELATKEVKFINPTEFTEYCYACARMAVNTNNNAVQAKPI